ncbi:MAG: hypothetical protein P9M15_00290 [Candidatus Electryoneaceae bacterium]|nr:hypothetical protein [Candidatus Electryoneaceae bacterium]
MKQNEFWDKLKQTLRDVSTAAADFTEEQALIGKLKFEVLNIKRKLDRLFRDLGIRVRDIADVEPLLQPFEDDEVNQLLESIKDLEEQVKQKRDEIDNVAAHFREKAASRQQGDETSDDPDEFDDSPPTPPAPDTPPPTPPAPDTPPEPEAKPDPIVDDVSPEKPKAKKKPKATKKPKTTKKTKQD